MQRYYEEKCVAMHKSEKKMLLQNKIKLLDKEIVTSNRNIELKSKKKAEEGVTEEMENTGNSRSQSFGIVYDEEYRREVARIQNLVFKKQLAEVELFIISEQTLNDGVRKGWTEDMIKFYEARIAKPVQDAVLTDEVGVDQSAHADFMTQNIVSSAVDAAMASMVNNVSATPPSNIQ